METELMLEEKKQRIVEEKKKFLKEIIDASARYERLLANSDFINVLSDLKNLCKLHEDEIQGYLKAYSMSTSFFKRMRLMEVLGQHQLRKEQIENAINYPAMIVSKANEAREDLAKISEQERENHHA